MKLKTIKPMIQKRLITASECGYDACLAFNSIFGILQDAVTKSLGEIGCDNCTLRYQYHSMWVFCKNKAKVFRRPSWNEEVIIDSKVTKANRLICYIKTLIKDNNNNVLIEGIVECCVLDINTFKFVRLSEIPFSYEEEETDTVYNFEVIEENKVDSFVVNSSLVDLSMHLNNAKALIPIENILGINKQKELYSSPFEIDVKYVSQAMYETHLSIHMGEKDGNYSFTFKKDDDSIVDIISIKRI